MPGTCRRTGQNDKKIADEGRYALSRSSLEHSNHKICSKDRPVTALFLRGSDGRYIIFTLVSLEHDARWRFLSPVFLPVQGSEQRNHLGSGAHVNVDGLEPVSPPPVILFQVDLQKEQMIDVPESTGSTKSCIANSSSAANVLKQSRNRNKRTKSLKDSSSTGPLNCIMSNDSSSGLVFNASTAAVSDVLVEDIPKVDKPVKRSSRKKAKKKGKQYKRSIHKKGSIVSEAVCEESTCKISVSQMSVDGDPSFSSKSISENNLTGKPTLPSLSVQATTERDDGEENNSDKNPSTSSMTCASHSDQMDESDPVASVTEDFIIENFSYNPLCMEESSSHPTDTPSPAETSEIILSTFNEDVTSASMKQSNNRGNISSNDFSGHYRDHGLDSLLDGGDSGNNATNGDGVVETRICLKENSGFGSTEGGTVLGSCSMGTGLCSVTAHSYDIDNEMANDCHISSTYCPKYTVDTDDITERRYCGSEASSSKTCHPVILSKRGRHNRKVSGSSHGLHGSGSSKIHGRTGKDMNHSVWQKVQKNDSEECICYPKNVNSVSSRFDVVSQGSEIRVKNDAFVWLRQNENGKSCTYPCIDEMVTQTDTFRVASSSVDLNQFLCKSKDGKLENNVPEKLKRKSGPIPKQELNYYSRRGTHTGKTHSKIFMQQKEALGISSSVNHHKSYTSALISPFNQRTPSDRTDCCPSEPQQQTHIGGATRLINVCGKGCDTTGHATQNQISPLSRTSDSLDKTGMQEVLSDSSSSNFHKDSHLSVCHPDDNEIKGCTELETEGSHAEQIKQNQNSGPVLQKWIPVGKKDAAVFTTCQIDTSSTSILDGLVSDGWISESLEVEQLNSIAHHFLPSTGYGAACSRPILENVNYSAVGDEGHRNKLKYCPLYTSKEQNDLRAASNCQLTQETKDHSISGFETDLNKITQVVNDSYRLQIASEGVELATGSPVAEFERLLHSTSPLLGQMHSLQTCKSCSQDLLIGDSLCQHQIPNISLGSFWQWYEKPGTYGLEVKVEDYHNSRRLGNGRFEFRAYFVPYLSAVQLFGKSRSSICTSNGNSNGEVKKSGEVDKMPKKSSKFSALPIFSLLLPQPHKQMDAHILDLPSSPKDEISNKSASSTSMGEGELLFEYFDSDQPQQRRPLFEKIQELVRGDAFSNCQIFGDPSKLERLGLHDLHPASWYSVAWYPIYRIPDGNLRAAFLTYHSLGHFIQRNASSNFSGGVTHIVSPVVGLQAYNAKGECWFEQRGSNSKAVQTEEPSSLNPSEILEERLRTLEQTASVMARASVKKGDLRAVNRQPDYEFFLSRRR